MKNTFLTKFILITLALTIGFSTLSAFAIKKAKEEDKDISQKIETALKTHFKTGNFSFNIAGISNNGGNTSFTSANYKAVDKIYIKTISSNIKITRTSSETANINGGSDQVIVKTKGSSEEGKPLSAKFENNILTLEETADSNSHDFEVILEIPEKFKNLISIQTISGDVDATNVTADDFKILTVSGDINVDELKSTDSQFHSVSGEVRVANITTKKLDVDTISGDVAVTFSKPDVENGYAVSTHSVSGDIKNTLKANEASPLKIKISTTSGDILVE